MLWSASCVIGRDKGVWKWRTKVPLEKAANLGVVLWSASFAIGRDKGAWQGRTKAPLEKAAREGRAKTPPERERAQAPRSEGRRTMPTSIARRRSSSVATTYVVATSRITAIDTVRSTNHAIDAPVTLHRRIQDGDLRTLCARATIIPGPEVAINQHVSRHTFLIHEYHNFTSPHFLHTYRSSSLTQSTKQ